MDMQSPVAGPSSRLSPSTNGDSASPGQPHSESTNPIKPFVCREGCTSAFGTQGHRSRHERSHKQDARNVCPRCEKRFVRSDVLSRHIQAIHGEGPERRGRKASCVSCAVLKVRCEGIADEKCDRCAKGDLECVYKQRAGSTTTHRRESTSEQPFGNANFTLAALDNPGPSPFGHSAHDMLPSGFNLLQQTLTQAGPSNESIHLQSLNLDRQRIHSPPPMELAPFTFPPSLRASTTLHTMPAFDFSFSSLGGAADAATTFDTSLGWGLGNHELDLLTSLESLHPGGTGQLGLGTRTNGTTTPSTDWLMSLTNFTGSNMDGGPSTLPPLGTLPFLTDRGREESEAAETMAELASSMAAYEGSSGNPWPNFYRPAAQNGPLTLPQVTPTNAPTSYDQHTNEIAITESCRQTMLTLVESSHESPWQPISASSFPSAATISKCVNLFFQRFDPVFPILNKERVRGSDIPGVLLLAMAAIGATYSSALDGVGVALAEILRRALEWLVYIVQATLLHSIFSLYSGSRKLYHHCEVSRSALVTSCRRMGLLRSKSSCVEDLIRSNESPASEELRRAYIEDEERLRLGWGIYIFDSQLATLLNIQANFSLADIAESTLLPINGKIYTATSTTLDQWTDCPPRLTFRKALNELVSRGQPPQALTPFSTTIIALTLYRLCIDAANSDSIFSTSANRAPSTSPYRISFPATFVHNPQALMDMLASSWYRTSSTPSPMMVTSTALSHHAAIAFALPDFIVQVKICAGKDGPVAGAAARAKMTLRIRGDPVAARRIVAHAAQLSGLLMRFTFDAPAEACWLTDSAIALWAILKLGGNEIFEGPLALSNRTTLSWSDSVEDWILLGGPMTMKGTLGDLAKLTPHRVLSDFSSMLETMPWSLWRKLHGVLAMLIKEEEETGGV